MGWNGQYRAIKKCLPESVRGMHPSLKTNENLSNLERTKRHLETKCILLNRYQDRNNFDLSLPETIDLKHMNKIIKSD